MDFLIKRFENPSDSTLKCILGDMPEEQVDGFCKFLAGFGASYHTMRDKLKYRLRPFCGWQAIGTLACIREFAPEYHGKPEDFFPSIGNRGDFCRFMEKKGMGRVSCYTRFGKWQFKHWETVGLIKLAEDFRALKGE